MKNFITLFAISFIATKVIFAQQTPVFADYAYNAILINPAHAGFKNSMDFTLSNRSFVSNFQGLPNNTSLTLNSITKNRNIGFGVSALRDDIGVTSNTQFKVSFAYKIIFDEPSAGKYWWDYTPHVFTFGLSAGALWRVEDLLSLGIENDVAFSENINEIQPTVGVGFLYNRNSFYIGFSNTNVIGSSFTSNNTLNIESPSYLYSGLRLYATRYKNWQIKPNFLLKYVANSPFQLDTNIAINYQNKIGFGLGYRTDNSLNILGLIGGKKSFRFLINYNVSMNDSPIDNSFGILLQYSVPKKSYR